MRKVFIALALLLVGVALPAGQTACHPPAGQWARKAPAEVGMDAARLNEAVEFMKTHETRHYEYNDVRMNRFALSSRPSRTDRAG